MRISFVLYVGLGVFTLSAQVSPVEFMTNASRVTKIGVTVSTAVEGQLQMSEPALQAFLSSCRFETTEKLGSKPHLRKLVGNSLRFNVDGSCTADWMEVELAESEADRLFPQAKPIAQSAEVQPMATLTQHQLSVLYLDPVNINVNEVDDSVQYWATPTVT